MLYENLPKFESNECVNFKIDLLTRKTPLENFEIIKKIYKRNKINLDLEKLIRDGTISTIYYEKNFSSYGRNYYNKTKKLIDCCNNGLLIDSLVMIHELSHYRNQPDIRRGVTNDLLTEAVATVEELIFMDYLKDLGYKLDVDVILKYNYNIAYLIASDVIPVYKMGILFDELSSLSQNSYDFYYGSNESYENNINNVYAYIKDNKNILVDSWYIMAFNLGTYMYYEYKKNPEFLYNIESLHTKMNNEIFIECLKAINLRDLGEEDMAKIRESLINMKNEIGNISHNLALKKKFP